MVPSSSTGNQGFTGSGDLSVFLATLVWGVVLCLIGWMFQMRSGPAVWAWPPPPALAFWALAPVTLVLGWLARRQHKQGYIILGGSLLLASSLFMMLG